MVKADLLVGQSKEEPAAEIVPQSVHGVGNRLCGRRQKEVYLTPVFVVLLAVQQFFFERGLPRPGTRSP